MFDVNDLFFTLQLRATDESELISFLTFDKILAIMVPRSSHILWAPHDLSLPLFLPSRVPPSTFIGLELGLDVAAQTVVMRTLKGPMTPHSSH